MAKRRYTAEDSVTVRGRGVDCQQQYNYLEDAANFGDFIDTVTPPIPPVAPPSRRNPINIWPIANKEGLLPRSSRLPSCLTAPTSAGSIQSIEARSVCILKVLKPILADHSVWAKLPEPALHDGSNNWTRLSADLAELAGLASDL
jgi:hypothetical protein